MISITLEDEQDNVITTYQTVLIPRRGDIVYHLEKPYFVIGVIFHTNEPTSCGCKVLDVEQLADDAIDELRQQILN